MGVLFAVFLALLAALLVTVILGAVTMARGDEASRKRSNSLMKARVCLQAAALLTVLILAAGHD